MEPRQDNQYLTWTNRPLAELLRLSWPIAVSMLSYAFMTLVDTFFVGRLGSAALAGVGLGGIAAFTLLCGSFGLLRGVKVLVSQAVGAGRGREAEAYLGAGTGLAVGIGLLTVGLGQALAALLPWIAASAASGHIAQAYLRIRVAGAPMVLVYVALREYRYGVGDGRSPMVANVLANVINVALDYFFVIHLEWGVEGAAWATVIGHGAEAIYLLAASRISREAWRASTLKHVRDVLRVGVPTGLQFMLEVGAFSLLTALLAALSETAVAAHPVALSVLHFAFLPTASVAEAASVLAGQAVGARREDLVPRIARLSLAVAMVYAIFCTLVLGGFAGPIASAFTDERVLWRATVHLLWVAAVFQIFDAASVISRGVLRGTGDVRVPALIGVACAWLFTPPLTWLLGYHLGLGALGGWLGLCGEIIVGSGLLWRRLAHGDWRAASRATRDMLEAQSDSVRQHPLLAQARRERERLPRPRA